MPDPVESTKKKILSTGNTEIDKKIADGLPLGSLTLIEGENDTGKSVLTQQIMWAALKEGLDVDLFTTECTVRSFLSQMELMNLAISDYFAWGYLRLYQLSLNNKGWSKDQMSGILERIVDHIRTSKAQIIVIDSFTLFTEFTTPKAIINFLNKCKSLADSGKTILITLHSYAFDEDTLIRLRSICDSHYAMRRSFIGDKFVMVLEVLKVHGAQKTTGNIVSFEVQPGYGMKIIPISMAKI